MSVVGGISKKIAPIAVDIYNREQNTHLEFWKVLDDSTTERVDDGMTYHIIFKAANSGSMNTYKATVLVHLVDFKPATEPIPVPVDDIYVKLAEFAVDEHNRDQVSSLLYVSV
ncbi:putative cystatin [Helianthus anomalus]